MKVLLLLLVSTLSLTLFAQNLPTMKTIPAGTMVIGGGYQYRIQDYYMVLLGSDEAYSQMSASETPIGEVPRTNNPNRRVSISTFYLSETEVTNAQYRDFIIDSLLPPMEAKAMREKLMTSKAGNADAMHAAWSQMIHLAAESSLLPDTNCWTSDFRFANNAPLVHNYFWHPAFENYPVVGVSWVQAKAYCTWLTTLTEKQKGKNEEAKAAYRLPSESEWEFAARGYVHAHADSMQATIFPWQGKYAIDSKGRFRANIKTAPGDYIGDNYEYTAPVKSFPSNDKGLYDMAGNVSEWCEDAFIFQTSQRDDMSPMRRNPRLFEAANETVRETVMSQQRVVKGGSWADLSYGAMSGSRAGWPETMGGSRVGFRVAQSKLPCERINTKQYKHKFDL